MKKSTLTFVLTVMVAVFILSSGVIAQQAGAGAAKIPEKVNISLDALLKTRTSNGIFNMQYVDSFFFASQGSVYVNVLFTADIDKDREELKAKDEAQHAKLVEDYNKFVAAKEAKLEEINKKIREENKRLQESKRKPEETWEKPAAPQPVNRIAYHNLYMRVVQDGKVVQEYKAPMPYEKEPLEYYSFGIILAPGKYDVLLNIDRFDASQDGTLLVELDVPNLTVAGIATEAKKITTSTPVFYKKINTLHVEENRFNVARNSYQVSPYKQEFFPFLGKEKTFKASDTPTLTFFISGINPPWNVEVKLDIKQGKKNIVSFKIPPMQNPYFFQPLQFKDKDKKLIKPGDYVLHIELVDKNKKGRDGKVEIPFKIVE